MRPLEPHELDRARAAFEATFDISADSAPYRPTLPGRMLMYPIDYTMLTPDQFGAVAAAAAAAADEHEAYVAALGAIGEDWSATYDHAVVELRDYASYKPPDSLVLEHALYSPSGAWGILTSDAQYAVAGGSEEFVGNLRAHLPADEHEMSRELIRDVREMGEGGAYTGWLEPLVQHVYGSDAATLLGRPGG